MYENSELGRKELIENVSEPYLSAIFSSISGHLRRGEVLNQGGSQPSRPCCNLPLRQSLVLF